MPMCDGMSGHAARRRRVLQGAGLLAAGGAPLFWRTPQARAASDSADSLGARDRTTVDHALGRTVVHGTPERIITLFQGATDTAVSLGVRPVGVVESWTQKPAYAYLRQALAGVAQVGLETQPSLEDIVTLEPDLIVASRFRNERIYGLLSAIAPTIALEDVFSFEASLALIAQGLRRTGEAGRVLARWQARVAGLRHALRERYAPDWPMTVSVLEFRDDHVRAYMPNSFSGSVLAQLGFARTPYQSDPRQTLQKITSREAIPYLDAQIIFVLMRADRPAVRNIYDAWRAHPLWQQLQAPAAQRVYEVDNVAWSLSGGVLGANLMLDEIARQLALPA